ncbi:hypothetical protein CHLRE_01g043450v5 [Chlamydomonas reinhardtii]|uniref:Uncharacterized protein n=1 Tax=Chlamydomonas reinhardtii TaxID=3055 RepID=A8HMS5_CHLRE|nr:uncharacterized protein CHLRE_01g043450v5 [Chlamydomonas reinhardtii]PNW88762.1 hypothetical protein CHLRE_01g043450v5 [Chlamydomonas reinhardtii]|eukprot:XP_001690177.1 predicted protein [Chlamydomonas reinhardtii]
MLLRAQQTKAFRPVQSKREAVRVHAAKRDGVDVKSGLMAAVAAAALLVGSPSVNAATMAEAAAEREQLINSEKQQLEYILAQQEIARRAALLAQRKAVEAQVTSVENQLQQKLTEQRANALAAEKQGDKQLADSFKANTAQLEEKAAQVQKAAAQIESRLDRVEMLQKAKAVAERQQVQRAAQDATDDVNVVLDKWIESISNLK